MSRAVSVFLGIWLFVISVILICGLWAFLNAFAKYMIMVRYSVDYSVDVGVLSSQIEKLKIENERQEIMIKEQLEYLPELDPARQEEIERDVVEELRSLRIDIKDYKSELTTLKRMLRKAKK